MTWDKDKGPGARTKDKESISLKKNRGISGGESATVLYGIPQRAGVPGYRPTF